MKKPAANDYPIHELLKQRWSPRAFSSRSVGPEILCSLFEAARWAPSCFNDQPWAYLVALQENAEEFARMASVLMEGNAVWAARVPVLAVSLARLSFHHNGQPNRHALHDVGAATVLLAIEATDRGLAVHQMGGFYPEKVRQLFAVPPDWEPVAAIAIGYPGVPDSLPEKLAQREREPRSRKPLSEFVMSGAWGSISPFVSGGKKA